MARTITRKITTSASDVKAVQKALTANPHARIFICRVAGVANGTKTNIHPQYGESVGLVGTFRRIEPTGETSDAPVLWGTDIIIEPVAAALNAGSSAVQVMADIYAVHSDKGTMGFSYVIESHGSVDDDPIAKLLGTAPEMPSLPAPATTKNKGK
jgi:hypothetical protein